MASSVLERTFVLVFSLVTTLCLALPKVQEPLTTSQTPSHSSSTVQHLDLKVTEEEWETVTEVDPLKQKGNFSISIETKGMTSFDDDTRPETSTSSLRMTSFDDDTRAETSTSSLRMTSILPKLKRAEPEELPKALPQKDSVKGYQRDDGTYIVEDSAEMPCVLAYFKSKITVYYPTDRKKEKYTSAVVSPPDDVTVSGKCDRDSLIAILDLIWDQGVFSLRFAFDDLTDSWYVDQFSFDFNTSMSAYKGADKAEMVKLKSVEKKRFWATSHARSFRCLLLHDVSLADDDELYSATIHFDEARVQALTKTKHFKTPKHCIHRVHRDEMVPITVGGVLAGCTLLTIVAYGIFRYFKIKKFQYGTME